jgi:hypothetical protein
MVVPMIFLCALLAMADVDRGEEIRVSAGYSIRHLYSYNLQGADATLTIRFGHVILAPGLFYGGLSGVSAYGVRFAVGYEWNFGVVRPSASARLTGIVFDTPPGSGFSGKTVDSANGAGAQAAVAILPWRSKGPFALLHLGLDCFVATPAALVPEAGLDIGFSF